MKTYKIVKTLYQQHLIYKAHICGRTTFVSKPRTSFLWTFSKPAAILHSADTGLYICFYNHMQVFQMGGRHLLSQGCCPHMTNKWVDNVCPIWHIPFNFQWLRQSLQWQIIQVLNKTFQCFGVITVHQSSGKAKKINKTLSLKISKLAETIRLPWLNKLPLVLLTIFQNLLLEI